MNNDKAKLMKDAEKQPKNNKRVRGKPFPKGVSGNPKGRTKGTVSLGTTIRAFLADKQRLPLLIERLYREDPKTLLAYGFGKPIESVEVSAPNSEPLFDQLIAAARQIAQ